MIYFFGSLHVPEPYNKDLILFTIFRAVRDEAEWNDMFPGEFRSRTLTGERGSEPQDQFFELSLSSVETHAGNACGKNVLFSHHFDLCFSTDRHH